MASPFSNDAKGVTSQAPEAPVTALVRAPEPTDPERKVGHDCDFVERPPKQFQSECSICLLILRDPHIISCCGHSFCEACIGRIREDGKPCPLCNKPGYTTLPNQGLQRALNEFDVRCSHRELGCKWVGTLGSLDGHLNAEPHPDCQLVGCQFVELKCIHCKTFVRRLAIAVHQNVRCPKRPYTCEYCEEYESTFENITSQHYVECKRFLLLCPNNCSPEGSGIERQDLEHHIQEDCPLTVVDCSLHYAGCEVRLLRRDLASHMNKDASNHVALLAAENHRMAKQLLEKDQQLTKENADLRSHIVALAKQSAQHQIAICELEETIAALQQEQPTTQEEPRNLNPSINTEAFVSFVTNDSYACGALALAKSLRDNHTSRRLALMITNGVSQEMIHRLSRVWDMLIEIESRDSGDAEHLALLARPELGITYSKINAWRLTQYSKCVFLDADTLVLQNVDELFEREELSAAPDIGWPDCFNSGVFVFEPSLETFERLLILSRTTGSFDGGDQGLLNHYWSDWATKDIKYHLPFIYNVIPSIAYGYAPAFKRFGHNIKIVHFIGAVKPWQHRYLPKVDSVVLLPGTYASQHAALDNIRRWWQVFNSLEQPS